MSYDNYYKRLEVMQKYSTIAERRKAIAALKINFSQPTEADEGYYRKPITQKDPSGNGRNIVIGWIPVSYYMWEGKLVGTIGNYEQSRNMTDHEIGDEELWSYVVSNPIPYEWYVGVVDRDEPWPDQHAGKNTAIIEGLKLLDAGLDALAHPSPEHPRVIARDDNRPPELLPEVEHAEAIDNAIGAAKDLKVLTVEDAARAAGAANILRDRRLAAEKVAKAKVDPLHAAYVAERDKWLPMVKRAKDVEDGLRNMVRAFEVAERKRVAAAQLEALEKQRAIDEANQRAADRAIAAAEPEPPPVVEDVVIPMAPPPVKPSYGTYRPRAKPVLKFANIYDWNAVRAYFQHNEELTALVQKLADQAVREGIEVPGTTIREGTE